MIEHDLVRLQKSERLNSTSAADATISAWRVRHLIRRWEERQCWSVQSIKGATAKRLSNILFSIIFVVHVGPIDFLVEKRSVR
jgi:cob(I)alamin adenosyltransferase